MKILTEGQKHPPFFFGRMTKEKEEKKKNP